MTLTCILLSQLTNWLLLESKELRAADAEQGRAERFGVTLDIVEGLRKQKLLLYGPTYHEA